LSGRYLPRSFGQALEYALSQWFLLGERCAILYAIIESCRRRGIDSLAYLRDVLSRLPDTAESNQQRPRILSMPIGTHAFFETDGHPQKTMRLLRAWRCYYVDCCKSRWGSTGGLRGQALHVNILGGYVTMQRLTRMALS